MNSLPVTTRACIISGIIILSFEIVAMQTALSQVPGSGWKSKKITIGLNAGSASQSVFPFNSPDYIYTNNYLKIEIGTHLAGKGRLRLKFLAEPGIYFSRHQLLNKYFVQPSWGENWLEQRSIFTLPKSFIEVALNLGVVSGFQLSDNLSIYLLMSSGPMYSGADTERLKKGFMFSDVAGAGLTFDTGSVIVDLRTSIRHNSNADLSKPNLGHNSVGIEVGVGWVPGRHAEE